MKNALLLGSTMATSSLSESLAHAGYTVNFVETSAELKAVDTLTQSIHVAIVTDSFSGIIDVHLLAYLKNRFSMARLLCIFSEQNTEDERLYRASGVVFYGTYDRFALYAEKILAQLSWVTARIRDTDTRYEYASNLERRLKEPFVVWRTAMKRWTRFFTLTS